MVVSTAQMLMGARGSMQPSNLEATTCKYACRKLYKSAKLGAEQGPFSRELTLEKNLPGTVSCQL
jgi:hypothetical protein